jgi:CheY-like chemotaxis protein
MQVPRYFKVAVQEGDYCDGLIDMRACSDDPSLGLGVDDHGPTFDPIEHKAHSVSTNAYLSFAKAVLRGSAATATSMLCDSSACVAHDPDLSASFRPARSMLPKPHTADKFSACGVVSQFELRQKAARGMVDGDMPDRLPILADRPQLILVVEDDDDVQAVLAGFLEHCGYRLALANDGNAGAEILRAARPDLLITDVQLRGGNGDDLAKLASAMNVPVLLISGQPEAIHQHQAVPVAFMQKPFRLDALKAAIEDLIVQGS